MNIMYKKYMSLDTAAYCNSITAYMHFLHFTEMIVYLACEMKCGYVNSVVRIQYIYTLLLCCTLTDLWWADEFVVLCHHVTLAQASWVTESALTVYRDGSSTISWTHVRNTVLNARHHGSWFFSWSKFFLWLCRYIAWSFFKYNVCFVTTIFSYFEMFSVIFHLTYSLKTIILT